MTNVEEILKTLNEYITLSHQNKGKFAIIINEDGSGQIVSDTWDINVKQYDSVFEFESIKDMVAQLKKIHEDTLEIHRAELLNKMREDMDQYGITVQDLTNAARTK
jgi:inosine/xanthosine triphosphate pyrophosphatase family protein